MKTRQDNEKIIVTVLIEDFVDYSDEGGNKAVLTGLPS